MGYGRAIIEDGLGTLELEGSHPVIYDREIGVRLLYEDPVSGAEQYIIRYPEGLQNRLHRHTAAQTVIVLEGRLVVNGRTIGPGSYAHFPAGEPMKHEPAPGEACVFVSLFDGPVDMAVLEE
jgi:quercetin dioxygenase-like cupin family protein